MQIQRAQKGQKQRNKDWKGKDGLCCVCVVVVIGIVYRESCVSFRRARRKSIDLDAGVQVHFGGVRSVSFSEEEVG